MKRLCKLSAELKGNKEKRPYAKRDYVPLDFEVRHKHSQGALQKDNFSDFIPMFSDVILTADSKEVDFISDMGAIGGNGFILSDHAKKIFDMYRLPRHRYYSLNIFHPKKGLLRSSRFYWLQVLDIPILNFVDVEKSKIYAVKNQYRDDQESFDIESKEQLVIYTSQILTYGIYYDKLVFDKGLDYDLFFAMPFEYHAFISEGLRFALEDSSIIGYRKFQDIEAYVALEE